MDAASVRVNATTIQDFPGKVVRVIGKVVSLSPNGDLANFDAAGPVSVSTQATGRLEVGKIYEIIGKVNVSDYSINSYSVMQLSDSTNLDAANKLAKMVPKVSELFY